MRAIDIHCHVVPAEFPPAPCTCAPGRWYRMDHRENQKAMVMAGQKEFRLVDHRCWDVKRRVADMNGEETDLQVLSPMPELLSYWIDADSAQELARHINTVIAEMVRQEPTRFVGLGMAPLQDPDRAAGELAAMKTDLGLVGVEIGSNINGVSPGDPRFDVFYKEAERLGLAIFVHALHPAATDRLVGPGRLQPLVSFPTDVGLAAASMVSGGILQKFPKLRVAFSHGGGTFLSFLPRLQDGWNKFEALQTAFGSPTEAARTFYYDNIVFNSALLRYMIDIVGTTQVCAGSDYPFRGGQKRPASFFDTLDVSPDELANLRGRNAEGFLALRPRA
jgi:aminocarboxymuconate-semialdehyde decarboxylase